MRFAALALSVALSACAATAEPRADAAAEFAALQALEARVAAVAWRLTNANTELCPDKGPQTGLTLHDAWQYAPESRAQAVRYFQLTDAPAVMAVAPGSPADSAGLRPGDVITSVNGASLRSPEPIGGPASYADVQRSLAWIDAGLSEGPAVLAAQRGGEARQLTVQPVIGCDYEVQLIPSPQLEASADGKVVSLTTGLARYAERDEDLALVIGHEMAHNVLRHRANPTGSSRSREREADRVGLYLTARAGYDISHAADFWRRFGDDNWRARLGVLTHPGPTARSRALAPVIAEIEARRAAGQPLTPALAD
ncbi:MAG TPA: M48 family metallopeptidase [Caulobacteraceae bacterium]|nr:M48 family metallopeptidase [Caulobacteraceae bacterium]